MNNTEYICVSVTNDNETNSDPAYIIIAGEQSHVKYIHVLYICAYILKIHICIRSCCYVACT